MEGSVYVLTNQAMPNMVKIGKTTRDVELRLADYIQLVFRYLLNVNMQRK